jgi:hypothetical protein
MAPKIPPERPLRIAKRYIRPDCWEIHSPESGLRSLPRPPDFRPCRGASSKRCISLSANRYRDLEFAGDEPKARSQPKTKRKL